MKKAKLKNLLLTSLAVAGAVLAPLSTANVSAQEATGEPLLLGVNLELTGAAAPYSVPAVEAFELFVEQVNA